MQDINCAFWLNSVCVITSIIHVDTYTGCGCDVVRPIPQFIHRNNHYSNYTPNYQNQSRDWNGDYVSDSQECFYGERERE